MHGCDFAFAISPLPSTTPVSAAAVETKPAQLRILMLHGFTQSGPSFRVKTRKLAHLIKHSLPPAILGQYPGGIRFLYPTGPLNLIPADQTGDEPSHQEESDNWAWWRTLDTTSHYRELDSTFQRLTDYISLHGPVDGVIGFSQGAALAAMFASWCESSVVPGRAFSLATQEVPLTIAAPQGPLKFAVCFAGFRGTEQYYPGFYEPKIETPIMHVMGKLDNMVTEEHTMDLFDACANGVLMTHDGGHYVPLQYNVLLPVVAFVESMFREPYYIKDVDGFMRGRKVDAVLEIPKPKIKRRSSLKSVVLCSKHMRVIRRRIC
ncbi:hypothetical protein BP5796_12667 [Coleophoma crateriformis]|uniref:Serine hydrolase domain-containing protein n=1 Tax=Coleophoma crateriformis TaxID=565419 RepID=A0A3D8Q6A4_9HELO|nr:hypothetical protein BP5796_12667 [Coleophoma crateriformis]